MYSYIFLRSFSIINELLKGSDFYLIKMGHFHIFFCEVGCGNVFSVRNEEISPCNCSINSLKNRLSKKK